MSAVATPAPHVTDVGTSVLRRVRARARQIPAVARWTALLAVLNGIAWGLIIPAFHVPDEVSHVAYTQYLAETGKLPRNVPEQPDYSPELRATLHALDFYRVIGRRDNRPPWTAAQTAALRQIEQHPPARVEGGNVNTAANNPPLYYAAEAALYRASPSHDLLDRLALMRLFSALCAGATALFTVLFLRELLPATPWAAAAGGLAVALQPLFGFLSGGVNNDNLLFAASAAIFFAMARIFRRGLTRSRAIGLGAAVAVGLLAKANVIAFLPALALGMVIAIARCGRPQRWAALRDAGVGVAVGALPIALYVLALQTVWDRPLWSGTDVSAPSASVAGKLPSISEQLSYAWQLFLPNPGLVTHLHPAASPPTDIWLHGFIGRFGWLDYGFSDWVYAMGTWAFRAVVVLALVTLVRERRALRRVLPELAVYALAVVGLCALIAVAGYRNWLDNGGQFEQARYLLPLLPLYGAIVALAVRAGGRRFGPALGGVAVMITVAWSIYAQVVTVERFWT